METIVQVQPGDLPYPQSPDSRIPSIDPALLKRHAPGAHYALIDGDHLLARCSIWTQFTPSHQSQPIGVIGHYAAADARSGVAILSHAADQLSRHGFSLAVGPMDGNTWRRYRLLTQRGQEPPFFLEPNNPDD